MVSFDDHIFVPCLAQKHVSLFCEISIFKTPSSKYLIHASDNPSLTRDLKFLHLQRATEYDGGHFVECVAFRHVDRVSLVAFWLPVFLRDAEFSS